MNTKFDMRNFDMVKFAITMKHHEALEIDRKRDKLIARLGLAAAAPATAKDELESPFPIIHNHGRNAHSAEGHCYALVTGGWAAKLKHAPAEGWQVIVTGFRGVQNAPAV